MADDEGRRREQRLNDEMERMGRNRDEREDHAPTRPAQGPRPARPEKAVTPGSLRMQQDVQGQSADTARKPNQAQLLHAMQKSWDFSGFDLSGEFSAQYYPDLQHLKNADGKVTGRELMNIENFKQMAYTQPKPDIANYNNQTYSAAVKDWDTARNNALAERARAVGGLKFSNTNLSGVNLSDMDFNMNREGTGPSTGVSMSFRGANLSNAQLQGTQFGAADFSGADMRGADASGARFEKSYLTGVKINEKTNLTNTTLDYVVDAPKDFTQQVKGNTANAKRLDKRQEKGGRSFR